MKKTDKQLEMPHGTASHRLRQSILWKYVQQNKDNVCFQCGETIETSAELSIEHKVPWLDSGNPVELFFSMNNIAFSHRTCNSRAARRNKKPCGTTAAYGRGCRCTPCKEARATVDAAKSYCKERRRRKYTETGH